MNSQEQEQEKIKEYFLNINEPLDTKRLVAGKISIKTYDGITVTTSPIYYLDDDGEECALYFTLKEQFTFGINANYPFNCKDFIPENKTGYQICYNMTTMDTVDNPTQEERQAFVKFDALQQFAWEVFEKEATKEDLEIPEVCLNSYSTAKLRKDIKMAVKTPYGYSSIEGKNGKKVEDRTKPAKVYVKLSTSGKGNDIKNHTKIYGPGDKLLSPESLQDVRGRAQIVFKLEGIFWGAHGTKAYGASLRFVASEINFTPVSRNVSSRRMLPPNENTFVPSDIKEEDSEDESFEDPMGDDKDDKLDFLNEPPKKKTVKPSVPKKRKVVKKLNENK